MTFIDHVLYNILENVKFKKKLMAEIFYHHNLNLYLIFNAFTIPFVHVFTIKKDIFLNLGRCVIIMNENI